MTGQGLAILLRMQRNDPIDKWWKRSEFQGTKNVRADLDMLVTEGFLQRNSRMVPPGDDAYARKVEVTFYRLAPQYREPGAKLGEGVGV